MNQRLKTLIPWAALLTAFTAGGAWYSQRDDVEDLRRDKLDVRRFELDSAYTRGVLDSQSARMNEVLARLHDICVATRAGCR